MKVNFLDKLAFLSEPHRYKVLYGGRVGIKSWSVAQHLLIAGAQRDLRMIPSARETMKPINGWPERTLTPVARIGGAPVGVSADAPRIAGTCPLSALFGLPSAASVCEDGIAFAPKRQRDDMVQLRTKWVSRVLLVLLAVMRPQRVIVAQQNPPKVSDQRQWKDYSYPDDGFVISLPYRVEPHDDETLSKTTFSAWTVSATNAYTLHLENLAVTLHVITFPDGCSNFFSQYRSLVRASAETDHTASSKFYGDTAAGHPAVENEHETKSGMRYYDRHQCADKKLYVFTANWPVDQARPSELGRVVRSFRLITK